MNKRIQILSFLFLGFSQIAFSQIKEEKLILDKKREPEVKKIEKKKTSVESIKNYPPEEKSANPVTYDITNVPAVSDFKTSTIQGEDISPEFKEDYQDNYVRFGMGNYGKILSDAHISTVLESKMEVGADFHFLSTNGLKDDYNWNSKQSGATLGAFLNSYSDKGKLNVEANFGLQDYNYYGIYALQPDSNVDLKQKTNQFQVNAFYDFYSNDILNDARLQTSFLNDHFDAKENQGAITVNLSKYDLFQNDNFKLNTDLGVKLETLQTDFSLLNQNSSNFFNASLTPQISFYKDNSYLKIGANVNFLNRTNESLILLEYQKSEVLWSPKVEILFAPQDEFKFYAGVDGGLKLNSYAELLKENPFLVSDIQLRPTHTKYHGYVGLKGDFDQTIKYDFSAGYSKINQMLFFQANDIFDQQFTLNRSAYNFANTYSAVYDNGNVSEVKGSVQVFPLENLDLGAELLVQKYQLQDLDEVFNKPLFQTTLTANYSMLDKKLNFGFKGIFITDRTSNSFEINPNSTLSPTSYVSTENRNTKVGGYADLNLSAEYKIHKNFSIFALGNNLLNTKYQTFNGYKVLGAQITGGVKITF
ncbi:TonB-dependent receptor [Halpernia frigidisoli]|uniref:TonB dependent receptor n=1 Tax=Halpernia frigidisoli TaxID=1125876 RepID=A0A1I3EFE5_9FLAO|nr:TonB-dependent receptor [Halpernia frigidisoli]SFH97634.1 TonB dependent receptor [Halpernia frigidisoli]